jgi:hypothetical protein
MKNKYSFIYFSIHRRLGWPQEQGFGKYGQTRILNRTEHQSQSHSQRSPLSILAALLGRLKNFGGKGGREV